MVQQRQVYIVGGAVRNILLGLPVNDIDYVVVGATIEQMLADGYQQVGADFPVFLKNGCEYALARTERKSGKGYHGFSVDANPEVTLEEDLMRRDLTINAMAVEVGQWHAFSTNGWARGMMLEGTIEGFHDPYNGAQDLQSRLIRPVKLETFVEDPLRVLRAARFAATYNMAWCSEMERAAWTVVNSGELATISKERYAAEIDKVLKQCQTSGAVTQFAFRLHQFGLIEDNHYTTRATKSLVNRANYQKWFEQHKSMGAKLIALCDDEMVDVFAARFGFSKETVDLLNFSHFALGVAEALKCDFARFPMGQHADLELLELYEDIKKGRAALTLDHLQEMTADYPQMQLVLDWLPKVEQVHNDYTFATVVEPRKADLQPNQYSGEIFHARRVALRALIDAEVEKGA